MPRSTNPRTRSDRPPLIGLTGAIGAGKSAALAAFARHGAAVLDSDAVVHRLYDREDVRHAVADRLGADVLRADGTVDRAAVARRIFADDELRQWLEGLLHPLVGQEFAAWAEAETGRRPPPRALVQEVPLLFETGGETRYDRTLVIVADDRVRRERIAGRGGLDRLEERESRLLTNAERIERADDVIANDGEPEDLDRAIADYLDRLGC
jgi:dephospho-CoA kinase